MDDDGGEVRTAAGGGGGQDGSAGLDVPSFDEPARRYELHIALTHLAYCAFAAGREKDQLAVARRPRELPGAPV